MLNNKGFAVSAVLYTTLIAFLLFLAVVLSMFSSSSDLVRNANTDLINGNKFEAKQVTLKNSDGEYQTCVANSSTDTSGGKFHWYDSPVIVKINSRYGTYYWPKDFSGDGTNNGESLTTGGTSSDGKLKTDVENTWTLKFTDQLDNTETTVEINPSICD